MTLKSFLESFNPAPDIVDDEAFALACDQAEGALRAGVRRSLAEYAAMTADLRAAWIVAGNRILRDREGVVASPTLRDDVSEWVDALAESIFGEAG